MRNLGKGLIRIISGILFLGLVSGCGGGGGSATAYPPALTAIEVTPTNPAIAAGTSQRLTATGLYSNGSKKDLTAAVTWSTATASIATVSNATDSNGFATAIAPGTTVITATSGSISGTTTLTVTAATLLTIQISPAAPSIAAGTSQQFTAIGIFNDNSNQDITFNVTWDSSNQGVATIGNAPAARGLATAVGSGTATISAAIGLVSGSTTLTVTNATLVSITLTPAIPTLAKGSILAFSAVGTYSDNSIQNLTTDVTWTSSAPAVASISNAAGVQGVARALASGATTITASLGSVAASTTLTVTNATLVAIEVTPTSPSVPLGLTQQFTAIGRFSDHSIQDLTFDVTWSSSNPALATISNASDSSGFVATVATGSLVITANFRGESASTTLTVTDAILVSIDVTPTAPSAPMGTTVQFAATGTYSDNSTRDLTGTATWSSSTPGVAILSNAPGTNGLAAAAGVGATTITATSGSVSGNTTLNVSAATLISIEVAPTNPSLPKGTTLQLTATGIYSDNTTVDLSSQVSWTSSNSATAEVSNTTGSNGLATAIDVGTSTITAATGGISGTTLITVTSAVLVAIDVTPTQPSIAQGTRQQFAATAIYSDNTTEDLTTAVTWTSSNGSSVAISNSNGSQGLATAVAPGTATIRATLGSVTGSTTLTVTEAILVSLEVTPSTPTIPRGTTQQFTATGIFSDDTTQDLTAQATWSSSDPTVASISNAIGSKGLTTALVPGTTTISATTLGMTGNTVLTVTPATLASIAVTPVSTTTPLGIAQQYTAIGTYTDDSTRDITKFVTWVSSNRGVATIGNSGGTKGVATPVSVGAATITATSGSITSDNATLTVTDATLDSITLAPLLPRLAIGTTQQFTATGHFSDNSTQNLTAQVTWNSSAPAVATISNEASSKGVTTVLGTGTTIIRATLGSVTASTTLTVTPATLKSITVTPANSTIVSTTTQQFTATGTFTDDSTQDLTKSVTWSSSTKSVATISNAKGTRGLVKGAGAGTTTIRAAKSNSNVAGTTTLTVE